MWVVFVCALKKLCEPLMRKICHGPREPPFPRSLFCDGKHLWQSCLHMQSRIKQWSALCQYWKWSSRNTERVIPPLSSQGSSTCSAVQCMQWRVSTQISPPRSLSGWAPGFRLNTAKTSKQHTALKTLHTRDRRRRSTWRTSVQFMKIFEHKTNSAHYKCHQHPRLQTKYYQIAEQMIK